MGTKKPGIARFVEILLGSDKSCISRAATNLSQLGERKFLNFNDFDDVLHDFPLLHQVDLGTVASCHNLERSLPWK